MEYKSKPSSGITPRLIIHGGAGNILPSNLPPAKYQAFHHSLLSILSNTHYYLQQGHNAVDTVTYAVTQLENNPLFNAGHGAVFTREGINECEASIMCSRGHKKRGVGVMGLRHVKNPIKLAREMLIRGDDDIEGGNGVRRGESVDGMNVARGAQGHSQLHKFSAEKLAAQWGLEMVEPSYFFTETRWEEHLNGLEKEKKGTGQASWDAHEFISQGTTGAVALDADGICAAATSTGGMTNKLTGRIGDTPTLGAGFWAEEWEDEHPSKEETMLRQAGPGLVLSETLKGLMADCLPSLTMYSPIPTFEGDSFAIQTGDKVIRATAMSGTGNGDSFLRINAARTASAIARFKGTSLQKGITDITGPGGELEKSAGNRWKKTGEGEGGIIGVECTVVLAPNGEKKMATSHIVDDFNCGGMFRAAVDKHGKAVMRVWRPGQYDDLEGYEGEGKQYDVREWLDEKMLL